MLLPIRDVLVRNVGNEWVRRVAVRQQSNDGQQDFRYGECRTPVVLQDVQTNLTL